MKKTYEKNKNDLLEKINYLEKQNKLMINDMKKEKFPNGALVYIVDYSDDYENQEVFRLGTTDNMNKRKNIYDTHMLHNKPVIKKIMTDKPLQLESCIRSMLYDYRYKNKKDFYICDKKTIEKAFIVCTKSIKKMKNNNQNGGGSNDITMFKENIRELDIKINEINKLL